ncbi:phosphoribosyltransferase family protein [Streptococcus parauberis]|uniref:ComF family protein n=2 Tax=Streptococcus parauberis TaxID=1348 RepID=UPI0005EF9B47
MVNKCLICGENCRPRLSFTDICFMVNRQSQLCETCSGIFERIGRKHCPICCKVGLELMCSDCKSWFENGVEVSHKALYKYNLAMKDYFSKYKFQGDYLLKSIFSKELKIYIEKNYEGYTNLVVPISQSRMETRGFNQVSSILADVNIPYIDILRKCEGKKQSEKTKHQRLESENQFSLLHIENLPKKILIIDDIYTTGTTISQIRKLLHQHGINDIKSVSIAR